MVARENVVERDCGTLSAEAVFTLAELDRFLELQSIDSISIIVPDGFWTNEIAPSREVPSVLVTFRGPKKSLYAVASLGDALTISDAGSITVENCPQTRDGTAMWWWPPSLEIGECKRIVAALLFDRKCRKKAMRTLTDQELGPLEAIDL